MRLSFHLSVVPMMTAFDALTRRQGIVDMKSATSPMIGVQLSRYSFHLEASGRRLKLRDGKVIDIGWAADES